MLLVNYRNESNTNVFEYCMLEKYFANTKHLSENGILQFFKTAEFLGNIWIYGCKHKESSAKRTRHGTSGT